MLLFSVPWHRLSTCMQEIVYFVGLHVQNVNVKDGIFWDEEQNRSACILCSFIIGAYEVLHIKLTL